MRPRRRNRSLILALYVNAGLLGVILVVLLSRSGWGVGSAALAAPQGSARGGAAGRGRGGDVPHARAVLQLHLGLLPDGRERRDALRYEYVPGEKSLRLVSARYFHYDRDLKRFNTTPSPEDVRRLVEMEKNPVRGKVGDPGIPEAPPEPAGPPAGPATPAPSTEGTARRRRSRNRLRRNPACPDLHPRQGSSRSTREGRFSRRLPLAASHAEQFSPGASRASER